MQAHPELRVKACSRNFCWGLFNRKERWGLSVLGWILLFVGLSASAVTFSLGVTPFLAINQPLQTDILVVEGWIHKFAIRKAAEEFRVGNYRRVLTTGGPVTGNGGYVNDFQTSASVGADRLIDAGVPTNFVQMVPCRVHARDRTYASAVALREWLRVNNCSIDSVNILTEGFHARRTRLLFQRALGENIKVGVISVESPDYELKYWWRYSEGVDEAFGEAIAYLYAKFIFRP
jgi:uncharacterized SAM-binding protein YcdF (DUF218 family)